MKLINTICSLLKGLRVVGNVFLLGFFVSIAIMHAVDTPSIDVQGNQVVSTNPGNHTALKVKIQIDGITRTEPVQHIYYSINAGTIVPHATFKTPITRAISGGGLPFNAAKMKVWGTTISGSDSNGGSWSTSSNGG